MALTNLMSVLFYLDINLLHWIHVWENSSSTIIIALSYLTKHKCGKFYEANCSFHDVVLS